MVTVSMTAWQVSGGGDEGGGPMTGIASSEFFRIDFTL